MSEPVEPKRKSINSFQIIGRLFFASVGISGAKNRTNEVREASTLAWIGAIAIFILGHYAFIRLIIYLIRREAGQ